MAIADIAAYAHLTSADIEALGNELDSIRSDIEESLGERDAAYIRRTIRFQRTLEVASRLLIGCSRSRAGWALGTMSLAFAKCVETAAANGLREIECDNLPMLAMANVFHGDPLGGRPLSVTVMLMASE